MRQHSFTSALGSLLALGLFLSPVSALADGNVIQLKPLQTNGYTNTYNNNSNSSYSGSGTSTDSAYDTYYNPSSSSASPNTLHGRVISVPKGTLLSVHIDHPVSAS